MKILGALFIFGISGVVCVSFCGGGAASLSQDIATSGSNNFQAQIERKVADDAVAQYEVAKKTGSKMDACVHAGFVKAAFVQAKDEIGAAKWHDIERQDCRRAGVPSL